MEQELGRTIGVCLCVRVTAENCCLSAFVVLANIVVALSMRLNGDLFTSNENALQLFRLGRWWKLRFTSFYNGCGSSKTDTHLPHSNTHTHKQRALPSLAEMQKDVARRFGKIYFTGPKCAECTGIKLPAPVVTVELAREIRFSGYQPERNFVPARQHQSFVMPTMHVDMAAHEVNPTWTTDRVDLEAKSKSYGCVTLMLV